MSKLRSQALTLPINCRRLNRVFLLILAFESLLYPFSLQPHVVESQSASVILPPVPRAKSVAQVPEIGYLPPQPTLTSVSSTLPTSLPPTSTPTSQATPQPQPTKSQPTFNKLLISPPAPAPETQQLIEKYASQYKVDKTLMTKIAHCESHYNPSAVNGPYAGMYQFLASTWTSNRKKMGLDPNPNLRFNAEEAIKTTAFKISRDGPGAWPVCSRI